jgi:hypothetical protein
MDKPTMTDYVTLIFTLFDKFEQQMNQEFTQLGRSFAFSQKCFIYCTDSHDHQFNMGTAISQCISYEGCVPMTIYAHPSVNCAKFKKFVYKK